MSSEERALLVEIRDLLRQVRDSLAVQQTFTVTYPPVDLQVEGYHTCEFDTAGRCLKCGVQMNTVR